MGKLGIIVSFEHTLAPAFFCRGCAIILRSDSVVNKEIGIFV
jgi:hypothetical protein